MVDILQDLELFLDSFSSIIFHVHFLGAGLAMNSIFAKLSFNRFNLKSFGLNLREGK